MPIAAEVTIGDQVLPGVFRRLTAEEEADLRDWARHMYTPLSEIDGTWHPVVQDECRIINEKLRVG
jgi:hypothetical protein